MTARINGLQGEILEALTYYPGLQGGTDLELATKTVSATSEPAAADYTSTHTIPAPSDPRFAVLRLAVRLSVTIDSFAGGGAVLNYRVKRGGVSVSTGTLATGGSTGNKLVSFDVTANLTGAQTNEVFLWVDAGTCVISEVTLWSAVGSNQSGGYASCIGFGPVKGEIEVRGICTRVGTGNFYYAHGPESTLADRSMSFYTTSAIAIGATGYMGNPGASLPHLYANQTWYFTVRGLTVATDIAYWSSMMLILRRSVQ